MRTREQVLNLELSEAFWWQGTTEGDMYWRTLALQWGNVELRHLPGTFQETAIARAMIYNPDGHSYSVEDEDDQIIK